MVARALQAHAQRTVARDDRGKDFRPADIHADDPRLLQNRAGTIRRRMSTPGGEKPYRVYRGGRTKGRVPTVGRPEKSPPRPKAERDGRSRYRGPGPKATAGRPRQIRWGRELTIALVLIVAFFLAWAV